MLKIFISTVIFFISNDMMKLGFASGISTIAIFGILPSADYFIMPQFIKWESFKVLIDDIFLFIGIVNHFCNNFLLLLIIILANFGYLLLCLILLPIVWIYGLVNHYFKTTHIKSIQTTVGSFEDIYPESNIDSKSDDDNVSGEDDDESESVSLLTLFFHIVGFKDTDTCIIKKLSPPFPNSETYLEDLLRYKLSIAKRNKFCYIRCLDPIDRETFQAKMIEEVKVNCKNREIQELIITQGSMKMRTWRRIMKQICTVTTYKLWRMAYWGENAGRSEISTTHTRYHVLVESFNGRDKSKEVNLLHSFGHIERIPSSLIDPSSWSNEKASQKLWEEISS